MKVIVTRDFYDLKAFVGRQIGEVIEVPEDRGARLIEMRLAKAEAQKAEAPKAKPEAKPAAKKTAKKN